MQQSYTIALAGNPNCGKTTMFNALTGATQFVGNWPGVTVEKKEGKYKKKKDIRIMDLPGIYSLSPYSQEEVIARAYLVNERPDAIINIVDATNLERNLYLTTQLLEIGVPVVVALNMMDVVKKNGDVIHTKALSELLKCPVIETSALREDNIDKVMQQAILAAEKKESPAYIDFDLQTEQWIAQIQALLPENIPSAQKRYLSIKLFEKDNKVPYGNEAITQIAEQAEKELDDDTESHITGERYAYIANIIDKVRKKQNTKASISDRIDRIVTNRWLGLPIFALVMFLVYYIAMVTVGDAATTWANDGLFGDGWHLLGNGSAAYEETAEAYVTASLIVDGYQAYIEENGTAPAELFEYAVEDEETLAVGYETASIADYKQALATLERYGDEPDPADYGIWVRGIPVLIGNLLESANAAPWLSGLINDGIVAGVGAVLGFVPQMLVLFFMLAFLEACGYMARIAFVLDRIFRKFGLSGKSFIPMLVGMGCSVPGIMASRTIENERDRRMTIITTSFIPCGAKVPFIAMIAGAIFGGSAWVATSAYFVGMAAIVISGILLKKTTMFSGEPAPFVMELPAYHWPTIKNVLHSMWERGWSFIKKAGTVILLSTIVIWFTSYFGFVDGTFRMLEENEIDASILATIGGAIAWIFRPLGWGNWQATVAAITGLVAKENIVGTMGILYGETGDVYGSLAAAFTGITGYSFLVFNLLCAPCFAAIGAIKREMNSAKWTWFAVGYQCGFAYCIALMISQFGGLMTGDVNIVGLLSAAIVFAGMVYLLIRPYKQATQLAQAVKN